MNKFFQEFADDFNAESAVKAREGLRTDGPLVLAILIVFGVLCFSVKYGKDFLPGFTH